MLAEPSTESEANAVHLCSNLNACDYCADFVLVGDLQAPMKSLLDTSFASEFPDEAVWRDQYKKLTSRILAMQHMNNYNVSTVKRITGREGEVVAAFTEGSLFCRFWSGG